MPSLHLLPKKLEVHAYFYITVMDSHRYQRGLYRLICLQNINFVLIIKIVGDYFVKRYKAQ